MALKIVRFLAFLLVRLALGAALFRGHRIDTPGQPAATR
jgi:hypothetical protein